MNERKGIVTFNGDPLTLLGDEVRQGDKAPDFTALDNQLKSVTLGSFSGKTLILSAVPSLDTPVCHRETLRFNKEAHDFGENIAVVTISMDLPFAQARWVADNEVQNLITLSDHRDASFGMGYGVLIKELRLLARTVFIVDRSGVVRYIQMVSDIASDPDYDDALSALREISMATV